MLQKSNKLIQNGNFLKKNAFNKTSVLIMKGGFVMVMSMVSAGVKGPTVSVNKENLSPRTRKNIATGVLLGLAGYGAKEISKQTFGKSFAWNTSINKTLQNFAKNGKKFLGADTLKNIAGKLAKTTGRQKLLGVLALGTIGAVMAVREKLSKEEGAKDQKFEDSKNVAALSNAYKKKIELQDYRIARLEADNEAKDIEINSMRQTIDDVEKAAEKLGYDRELEAELHKQR